MVKPINTTEEYDAAVSSAQVVVADFYASWCGPCIAIAPKLEDWERRLLAANRKIAFVKVNVDQLSGLATRQDVTAMPTFLIYREGKLANTVVGANPYALERAVEEQVLVTA